MKTVVKYGNYDFGNQPTPFVTRSENFIKAGESWGSQEVFTLRGQITGCNFDAVRSGQRELISGFGQDFQKFQIGNQDTTGAVLIQNASDTFFNDLYTGDGLKNGRTNYSRFVEQGGGFPPAKRELSYNTSLFGYPVWLSSDAGGFPDLRSFDDPAPLEPYDVTGWTYDGVTIDAGIEVTQQEYNFIRPFFEKSGVKVESINFPSNKYNKLLDYEITLSHFPNDYFTTFYGVTNPVDSWDFNETEDGLLNITHTISCKGFNTNSNVNNAFDNARRFVNSRTGDQNMINPHFICKNTYPEFYPCLDTFSEQINRVDGSYSITENYISDLEGTGKGVLRYTVDLNSGINDFSTASIQGNIDACKSQEISVARARFKETSFFNLVSDVYNDSFGFVDLNGEALSSGVNEDHINKKIDFNIQWNNDHSPSTALDIQTNITSGDGLITVGINGNIRAKGDIRGRYSKMLEVYSGVNIFGEANNAYINYLNNNVSYPLNPNAQSSGVTRDQYTPAVSFQASFDNKEIPPSGFDSFQRNVSIKPSLRPLKPIALPDQNGTYDIIDLLFDKRASLNISLNGEGKANENADNLTQTMKNEGNLLLQTYGRTNDLKLESYSFSTGNGQNYNLNASWSFEAANKVFGGSYDQINTLKIK